MQTLPIAYYPALSDADIDKLLADDKPDTVEFMITPKRDVAALQVDKLAEEMQDVGRSPRSLNRLEADTSWRAGRTYRGHSEEPSDVGFRIGPVETARLAPRVEPTGRGRGGRYRLARQAEKTTGCE